MYRAKVEAISGIKVYAGGKWLRCIGNKSVRVGDMVWTDGKVVYGDYQESQQSVVITAPEEDDEGIPIIISAEDSFGRHQSTRGLYNYKKNKLKFIERLGDDKEGMMINDYKKQVYYAKDIPNINLGGSKYKSLLATNINKQGDRFDVVSIYDFIPESPDSEYGDIENEKIQICKNNTVIQTFNLAQIFYENVWSECPSPPPLPFVQANIEDYGIYEVFIEDEKNWRFLFYGSAGKSYSDEYIGSYEGSESDPAAPFHGLNDSYFLTKYYLFTANGTSLLHKKYQYRLEGQHPITEETYPEIANAKFLLQEGYYYKVDDINDPEIADGWVYGYFYDKNNNYLFTLMFYFMPPFNPNFVITKVQNKYLLGVKSDFQFDNEIYSPTKNSGLYLYQNGQQWKQLIQGSIANQRLRTIKKNKNWHKHIKELTLIE